MTRTISIRLHGARAEVDQALAVVRRSFHVVSVGRRYKDRNGAPLYRQYVDVALREEEQR